MKSIKITSIFILVAIFCSHTLTAMHESYADVSYNDSSISVARPANDKNQDDEPEKDNDDDQENNGKKESNKAQTKDEEKEPSKEDQSTSKRLGIQPKNFKKINKLMQQNLSKSLSVIGTSFEKVQKSIDAGFKQFISMFKKGNSSLDKKNKISDTAIISEGARQAIEQMGNTLSAVKDPLTEDDIKKIQDHMNENIDGLDINPEDKSALKNQIQTMLNGLVRQTRGISPQEKEKTQEKEKEEKDLLPGEKTVEEKTEKAEKEEKDLL